MTKSVYREQPTREILLGICRKLGIDLTKLPQHISKHDVDSYVWGDEVHLLIPYYIPSLVSRYFVPATSAPINNVTVIRHLLRDHGYHVSSKETTKKGQKVIVYTIAEHADAETLATDVVVRFL